MAAVSSFPAASALARSAVRADSRRSVFTVSTPEWTVPITCSSSSTLFWSSWICSLSSRLESSSETSAFSHSMSFSAFLRLASRSFCLV